MNNKGITLVELLVSIIASAILMLTIGVLSELAVASSRELRLEADIFNDIMYGTKILQKKVRESANCIPVTPGGLWIGERLDCGIEAIGVYNNSGAYELVYMQDKTGTAREPILLVSDTNLGINFTLNSDAITVRITGSKDNIPFDIVSTVTTR